MQAYPGIDGLEAFDLLAEHLDNHHHYTVEIVYFSQKYMVTLQRLEGTPVVGVGDSLQEAMWEAVREREADPAFIRCTSG